MGMKARDNFTRNGRDIKRSRGNSRPAQSTAPIILTLNHRVDQWMLCESESFFSDVIVITEMTKHPANGIPDI